MPKIDASLTYKTSSYKKSLNMTVCTIYFNSKIKYCKLKNRKAAKKEICVHKNPI